MSIDAYQLLMERLGHPEEEILLRILSAAMTAEEAILLSFLPSSTTELADKLNLDEQAIEDKLQNFKRRGLIIPSRKGFRFPKDLAVLHDATLSSAAEFIPDELPQLWKELYESGWWRELAKANSQGERPYMRVIPAHKAVPEDIQLLPWEDVNIIIDYAPTVAARDCCCRVMSKECASPTHTCIQFNRRAEHAVDRDSHANISKAEALAIAMDAEDSGLVPTVANVASVEAMDYICYCCSCCCIAINPAKRLGKISDAIAPSRFIAKVNPELCSGCKLCFKRCHFEAVVLENVPDSKKVIANIDTEKCFGCGLCVIKCKSNAVKLELARPPEHIPSAR